MMNDLGDNTIFAFSETWLKENDDEKVWQLNEKLFKTFRCDRKSNEKQQGGGVMIIAPKHLNPKLRKDLKKLNPNHFESLWIECNLNTDHSNKKKHSINVSYNPHKFLYIDFSELSDSIEQAIVENKPITLMGDYNIDYFIEPEQNSLDTVILPYGFRILNTNIPTRYTITDLNNSEKISNIISDTPLRTQENKPIDHFATTTITVIKTKRRTIVTIKEIFDEINYSKEFSNIQLLTVKAAYMGRLGAGYSCRLYPLSLISIVQHISFISAGTKICVPVKRRLLYACPI